MPAMLFHVQMTVRELKAREKAIAQQPRTTR
jgi:hypothetical protein